MTSAYRTFRCRECGGELEVLNARGTTRVQHGACPKRKIGKMAPWMFEVKDDKKEGMK